MRNHDDKNGASRESLASFLIGIILGTIMIVSGYAIDERTIPLGWLAIIVGLVGGALGFKKQS